MQLMPVDMQYTPAVSGRGLNDRVGWKSTPKNFGLGAQDVDLHYACSCCGAAGQVSSAGFGFTAHSQ